MEKGPLTETVVLYIGYYIHCKTMSFLFCASLVCSGGICPGAGGKCPGGKVQGVGVWGVHVRGLMSNWTGIYHGWYICSWGVFWCTYQVGTGGGGVVLE